MTKKEAAELLKRPKLLDRPVTVQAPDRTYDALLEIVESCNALVWDTKAGMIRYVPLANIKRR